MDVDEVILLIEGAQKLIWGQRPGQGLSSVTIILLPYAFVFDNTSSVADRAGYTVARVIIPTWNQDT